MCTYTYTYIYYSLTKLCFEGFLLLFFMCRLSWAVPLAPQFFFLGSPSLPLQVLHTPNPDTKILRQKSPKLNVLKLNML